MIITWRFGGRLAKPPHQFGHTSQPGEVRFSPARDNWRFSKQFFSRGAVAQRLHKRAPDQPNGTSRDLGIIN
jgi:hypothetical protein